MLKQFLAGLVLVVGLFAGNVRAEEPVVARDLFEDDAEIEELLNIDFSIFNNSSAPESGLLIEQICNSVTAILNEIIMTQQTFIIKMLNSCVDKQGTFDGNAFCACAQQQDDALIQEVTTTLKTRLIELVSSNGRAEKDLIFLMLEYFNASFRLEMSQFHGQHPDFIIKVVEAKTQQEALALLQLAIDVMIKVKTESIDFMINAKTVFLEQNFPAATQA